MHEVPPAEVQQRLRALPAISSLLDQPQVRALEAIHGHAVVLRALRETIDVARRTILAGGDGAVDPAEIERQVEAFARASLRPVLNATGVVVHTNLGRAPLAAEALQAVCDLGRGYSTLEYDVDAGGRGSRHFHANALLTELTGAEDAAVVNNNAGAVLLALSALARDREVVVSRGELVEIGGGFRIPDVMRQSGASLVEVGTTNRTRLADYEQALGDRTALLLKVHRSNFDVVGFTAEVELREMAELAHRFGVPLMYDAGSGCLRRMAALEREAPISEALAQGADLVTFSGDKLLGGPQAGLIVGRADLVELLRKHPLMRPLRPDKLCLAALDATLRLWRDAAERIPVANMLEVPAAALQARAEALAERLASATAAAAVEAVAVVDRVGGGASPLVELQGWALRIGGTAPDTLAAALRAGEPPVVARVDDDALLLHLRCVPAEEDGALAELLIAALHRSGGHRA